MKTTTNPSTSAPLIQLGNSIKKLREAAGLSQEELAVLVGIHRTFLSSVERGENNISFLNLVKLAGCLGVSVAELLASIDTEFSAASTQFDKLQAHINKLKKTKKS